jgi:hypothetical protein
MTAFVHQTFRSFELLVRQTPRRQQQAGTLPPQLQGVDIESADVQLLMQNFQMLVPREQGMRLKMALLLSDVWYVRAFLTVVLCPAAALAGRRRVES